MSKPLPNLTDLPPDVQDYIAAQRAEVMGLKADLLGLNLTHASAHKLLKNEMECQHQGNIPPITGVKIHQF